MYVVFHWFPLCHVRAWYWIFEIIACAGQEKPRISAPSKAWEAKSGGEACQGTPEIGRLPELVMLGICWDQQKVESSEKWLIKATCFGGEFLPFSQLRWILIWMILFRYHLDYDYIYIYIYVYIYIFGVTCRFSDQFLWWNRLMWNISTYFPWHLPPTSLAACRFPCSSSMRKVAAGPCRALLGVLGILHITRTDDGAAPGENLHITWMDDIEVVSTILSPAWPLLVTFQHSFRHSK